MTSKKKEKLLLVSRTKFRSHYFLLGLSLCTIMLFSQCKKQIDDQPQPQFKTETADVRIGTISHVIKLNESVVDGSTLNLPAGSFVGIEGGTRGSLLLKNFS